MHDGDEKNLPANELFYYTGSSVNNGLYAMKWEKPMVECHVVIEFGMR